MSAVTLTKTPARPAVCHVEWCAGGHGDGTRDYQYHRSVGVRPTHGLYASISWLEPLSGPAQYMDTGARVTFAIGDAEMSLSARQASALAAVMDELEQDKAAGLLRDMVARIGAGR